MKIRNPQATRPWQHVLEPLAGYLRLGQKLLEEGASYADGFNFGPEMNKTISVAEVAQQIAEIWGSGKVFVGKERGLHEANLLQLNIEKSKKLLDISPVYTARQAILKTVQWYKEFYVGHINMSTYTAQQIEEFVAMAKTNTLPWSMK